MSRDPSDTLAERCLTSPHGRRNEVRLAAFCLLWALGFAGAMWLLTRGLLPAGPIAWAVAALPSLAAVFVVLAFVRFLREADELQRLIQLQGLALGFGGGFFAIFGYSLFEQVGAASAGIDIVTVMPVLYAIGVLMGARRYR